MAQLYVPLSGQVTVLAPRDLLDDAGGVLAATLRPPGPDAPAGQGLGVPSRLLAIEDLPAQPAQLDAHNYLTDLYVVVMGKHRQAKNE